MSETLSINEIHIRISIIFRLEMHFSTLIWKHLRHLTHKSVLTFGYRVSLNGALFNFVPHKFWIDNLSLPLLMTSITGHKAFAQICTVNLRQNRINFSNKTTFKSIKNRFFLASFCNGHFIPHTILHTKISLRFTI